MLVGDKHDSPTIVYVGEIDAFVVVFGKDGLDDAVDTEPGDSSVGEHIQLHIIERSRFLSELEKMTGIWTEWNPSENFCPL